MRSFLRSILFGLCWANLWCFARLFAHFCRLTLWRKANNTREKIKKLSLHCLFANPTCPCRQHGCSPFNPWKATTARHNQFQSAHLRTWTLKIEVELTLKSFQEPQTYDMTSCFTNVSTLRVFKVGWGGERMITFLALAIRTVKFTARKFGSKSGLMRSKDFRESSKTSSTWSKQFSLCLATAKDAKKKRGKVKKRFVCATNMNFTKLCSILLYETLGSHSDLKPWNLIEWFQHIQTNATKRQK